VNPVGLGAHRVEVALPGRVARPRRKLRELHTFLSCEIEYVRINVGLHLAAGHVFDVKGKTPLEPDPELL
jgi:hypothetical protein